MIADHLHRLNTSKIIDDVRLAIYKEFGILPDIGIMDGIGSGLDSSTIEARWIEGTERYQAAIAFATLPTVSPDRQERIVFDEIYHRISRHIKDTRGARIQQAIAMSTSGSATSYSAGYPESTIGTGYPFTNPKYKSTYITHNPFVCDDEKEENVKEIKQTKTTNKKVLLLL